MGNFRRGVELTGMAVRFRPRRLHLFRSGIMILYRIYYVKEGPGARDIEILFVSFCLEKHISNAW